MSRLAAAHAGLPVLHVSGNAAVGRLHDAQYLPFFSPLLSFVIQF